MFKEKNFYNGQSKGSVESATGEHDAKIRGVLNKLAEKIKTDKKMRALAISLSLLNVAPGSAKASDAGEDIRDKSREKYINSMTENQSDGGLLDQMQETEDGRLLVKLERNNKGEKSKSYREKRNDIAEDLRRKFIKHVGSKEYLDKLTIELDGDIKRAQKEQKFRVKELTSVEIDVNSNKQTWPEDIREGRRDGYYSTGDRKIYVDRSLPSYLLSEIVIHELAHASTRGPIKISKNAFEKLTKAYVSPNNEQFDDKYGEKVSYGMKDDYLSWSTEMLARKQQLDLEMESLGIKKYGEEFTNDHYDKVIEMYQQDAFGYDSKIFIEIIKKDPEVFKEIFNKIAKLEKNSDIKSAT